MIQEALNWAKLRLVSFSNTLSYPVISNLCIRRIHSPWVNSTNSPVYKQTRDGQQQSLILFYFTSTNAWNKTLYTTYW